MGPGITAKVCLDSRRFQARMAALTPPWAGWAGLGKWGLLSSKAATGGPVVASRWSRLRADRAVVPAGLVRMHWTVSFNSRRSSCS